MRLPAVLVAAFLAATLGTAALAEPPVMSAPQAFDDLQADRIIMLDIRTPGEWAETGVAQGAWPVSMHRDDFGRRLQAIFDVYPTDQIALICATGGRTAHVLSILERAGITGVSDVSESMLGNKRGPGWVARGLPIVSVEAAMQDYEATMQGHASN